MLLGEDTSQSITPYVMDNTVAEQKLSSIVKNSQYNAKDCCDSLINYSFEVLIFQILVLISIRQLKKVGHILFKIHQKKHLKIINFIQGKWTIVLY